MRNKFRIGYFADGLWSHKAFELLIADDKIEIAFIVPRTDSLDNQLLYYANKYQIPYLKGVKINSEEFYTIAAAYQCDLFVSMSFNQIFKEKITNLPPYGTINCHAGKLPYYRGRNILNWAIINDEKEFGITVHFIDNGIDTGDIILQRCFPITSDDTYGTLLEVAHIECANILYDAIKMVQADDFERIKQYKIHPVGFYCGQRGIGDEIINWRQNSRNLFNFIRAISSPGPKAQGTVNGVVVKINGAAQVEGAPNYICREGQIVGKTQRGFIVKALDNVIEIFDLETTAKLKMGDKFDL
jgi:methionyl-tRNA formyltransferase